MSRQAIWILSTVSRLTVSRPTTSRPKFRMTILRLLGYFNERAIQKPKGGRTYVQPLNVFND